MNTPVNNNTNLNKRTHHPYPSYITTLPAPPASTQQKHKQTSETSNE